MAESEESGQASDFEVSNSEASDTSPITEANSGRIIEAVDEAVGSVISSETEGPDSQSVMWSSGETGGPDSDVSLSDTEDGVVTHDQRRRGMVIKQGDTVSFVADNLNEQIRRNSPGQSAASKGSRRSSLTSDAMSSSADQAGMSCKALTDIELHAKTLGHSVDRMLSDLQTNLHTMSAITVGCAQTYKGSVDKTLDEVDSNIKLMYTFMAKCEELNSKMKNVHQVADEINDIKRILDMFEGDLQLHAHPT
ncbi:BLOC-1-related complex subunit 6-like [Watersipora subatra]|uniref:BLOC-1-related complex subunit 6-like n=1 Tax=Watersipora subatra TaxID=2589382 RepID=UPI00355B3E50